MIGCYARVSTTEQVENGNSISEQQDRMQKYGTNDALLQNMDKDDM